MYSLGTWSRKNANIQSHKVQGKKQVNYHWQGHNMIFRSLITPPRLFEPLGMSLHCDIQFIYLQIKQETRVLLAEWDSLCCRQHFSKRLGTKSGHDSTKHELLVHCQGWGEKCIPRGLFGRSLKRTEELGLPLYLALKHLVLEGCINVWRAQFKKLTKEPRK